MTETSWPGRPLDPAESFFYLLDRISCMNFVVFAERAGHLDPEHVRAALEVLRAVYPLLQVRISAAPKSALHFSPGAATTIPVQCVATAADRWQDEIAHELARPFATDEAPLVRCLYLHWSAPQRCVLALTFHHCIADGRSGTELLRHLLRYIAAPRRADSAKTATLQPPLHAAFPAPFRWAEQPDAAEQALDVLLRDYKRLGRPTRLPWLATEAADRRPRFIRVALAPEVVQKLLVVSRRRDTTLHGALCAAQLLATHQLLAAADPAAMFLSCPVDMRPLLAPALSVAPTGLYITMIAATFAVDGTTGLWDLAREVTTHSRRQLARGDGHLFFSLYDLDRLVLESDGLARFTKRVMATPHGSSVSNVGRIAAEESDLAVDAISFVLCPMPYQAVFSSVSTYADQLIINVAYDAGKLADATATALANAMHARLLAGAQDG